MNASKVIKKNLLSGGLEKIITIAIGFFSVPLALNYFGSEVYTIVAITMSLMAYLEMSNFGIPSALAILIGRNDNYNIKKKIEKNGIKIIVFYSLILAIVIGGIIKFNLLTLFFSDNTGSIKSTLIKALTYCMLFFPLSLLFSIEVSLYFGYQKTYVRSILNFICYILKFLFLILVINLKLNIINYVVGLNIITLLERIFKYIIFKVYINKQKKEEFEQIEDITQDLQPKYIMKTGYKFFLMSLSMLLVQNTDNFVISKVLGLEYVTRYSITFKLITIILSLIYLITGSLKPLISKKIAEKDFEWISLQKKKYEKIMLVLGSVIWIGLILFSKPFISIWSGSEGFSGLGVVVFLGGYAFLYGLNNILHDIIVGFNKSLVVAGIMILEGVLNLIVSIILSKKFGLIGIAMGTFIASCGTYLMYSQYLKKKNFIKIDNEYLEIILCFLIVIPFIFLGIYDKLIISILVFILSLICIFIFKKDEIKNIRGKIK